MTNDQKDFLRQLLNEVPMPEIMQFLAQDAEEFAMDAARSLSDDANKIWIDSAKGFRAIAKLHEI